MALNCKQGDLAIVKNGHPANIGKILLQHGIRTRITPRLGLEEGINAARTIFPQCWFDERKCEVGLRALQFYRQEWKDRQGQFAAPVHDWASHGADAFRYFAVASRLEAAEYGGGGPKLAPIVSPDHRVYKSARPYYAFAR